MKIIGGLYGGRKIKSIPGKSTRPTSGLVREALFDILGNSVIGSNFVDVYAGTGAVGIEALSRGAKNVVFIENNLNACTLIRENLKNLDPLHKFKIFCCDDLKAFRKMTKSDQTYDIIFLDPPYYKEKIKGALEFLRNSILLCPETVLVVQNAIGEEISFHNFNIIKQKRYGKTLLSFLRGDTNEDRDLSWEL